VDPSTGRPRLEWDPGQGVSATPVYADQHLYVLSNNGYLYALRLERRGI
jgi:outer membrane protein assembly factor BamB